MADLDSGNEALSVPTFRPKKRQKVYRKRDTDDEDLPDTRHQTPASPTSQSLDELPNRSAVAPAEQASSATVASLIRQRQALQRKRLGIEYSATKATGEAQSSLTSQLVNESRPIFETEHDDEADMVAMRFAPQTGQVADIADKHMMAYIDAELAKRAAASRPERPFSSTGSSTYDPANGNPNPEHHDHSVFRQPAALGKLFEIDLGPDAKAQNEAATRAAHSRLQGNTDGNEDVGQDEVKVKKRRKPRLGRDGKPLPPRRPRRRNSEDVQRDKLVEEILKESKISVDLDPNVVGKALESSNASAVVETGEVDDSEAADDRIVEQFRQEWYDAMSGRRRRPAPSNKPSEQVERLKGPKLGGSRSIRAAVREKELQLQREREKEKRFGRR